LRGMAQHADCRPVQGASASCWMGFGSPLIGRPPYAGVLPDATEAGEGRPHMGEFHRRREAPSANDGCSIPPRAGARVGEWAILRPGKTIWLRALGQRR
jgi:hypothetical protein